MNGSYLLDTNIVIAFFRQEENVVQHVSQADIYVPIIVVGELAYGAFNENRSASDLARIHAFIADVNILGCDERVAEAYGEIKAAQRRKGCPLPENDLWIAAIAQRHALTLVSRDGHFEEIAGIALATW
jgi:tRNA(fMet)-specific endonuclease VapC